MKKKTAVILFNLGGPDSLGSVKKFLFNLFYDRAIIDLPNPFRFLFAKFMSNTRKKKSSGIYAKIGGKSTILDETKSQASALENYLNKNSQKSQYKVFISMRYWHPFSFETIKDVELYMPDEVVLLPLYPQYSITTTESSIKDWFFHTNISTWSSITIINHYHKLDGIILAYSEMLIERYKEALKFGSPIVLFSAHSLPQKVIDKGDIYQKQIEESVDAIMQEVRKVEPDMEYMLCYQSKVGPLKWLEPFTEEKVVEYSIAKKPIIVLPIAFVSEHSETLYELDIEYKELAKKLGCPCFSRVPALSSHHKFIKGLADLIL